MNGKPIFYNKVYNKVENSRYCKRKNQNRGSIERKPGLVFYTKYFTLPFPNGGELDGRGYKEGAEHR